MAKLLDNRSGKKSSVLTDFFIHKNGNILSVHFDAYDSSLKSYSNKDNDELYKGDVVEIFLDIGEPDSYLEIEVAPNGAKFVANIINREIHFIDNNFVKVNSKIEGNNYFVDIEIDLSKYATQYIKYNAFRIETKGIKQDYILLALNPTLSNTFHVKEKFITL